MSDYVNFDPEPENRVSTNPCALTPSFSRLIACSEGHWVTVGYAAFYAVVAWAIGKWTWWWLALPVWCVCAIFVLILILGWMAQVVFYSRGDLAAGVVYSTYPLHTVVLVDLRKHGEIPHYALVMLKNDCPKIFSPKVGSHAVCAVVYGEGGSADSFDDVSGAPVCLATWSSRKVQTRHTTIPKPEFSLIESAISDGIAPTVPKQVVKLETDYLAAHGFVIEPPRLSSLPPPLPKQPPPLPKNGLSLRL
jgi:hypothetical protein